MQTLIVSAFIAGRTDAGNFAATADLMTEASNRGLGARLCHGRWEGKDELSVAVDVSDDVNLCLLIGHLLRKYQQDAVLLVKDSGECFIVMIDDEEPEYLNSQYIGRWTQVHPESDEDFTYMNGLYYRAVKE